MENLIVIRSLKMKDCNGGKIVNYNDPIEFRKIGFADGTFLYDSLCGTMFPPYAKEVKPGVYESCSLSGHFMYESAVDE